MSGSTLHGSSSSSWIFVKQKKNDNNNKKKEKYSTHHLLNWLDIIFLSLHEKKKIENLIEWS
jgi:hypothetical protein